MIAAIEYGLHENIHNTIGYCQHRMHSRSLYKVHQTSCVLVSPLLYHSALLTASAWPVVRFMVYTAYRRHLFSDWLSGMGERVFFLNSFFFFFFGQSPSGRQEEPLSCHGFALDKQSGDIVWASSLIWTLKQRRGPSIKPTPAFDRGGAESDVSHLSSSTFFFFTCALALIAASEKTRSWPSLHKGSVHSIVSHRCIITPSRLIVSKALTNAE